MKLLVFVVSIQTASSFLSASADGLEEVNHDIRKGIFSSPKNLLRERPVKQEVMIFDDGVSHWPRISPETETGV